MTRHLFTSYGRPKTRILRTENQGLAKARNLGIREARGRFISCLDADDLFEPTFLEHTVEVLESDPSIAFASCWLRAFGDSHFDWSPSSCDFPRLLTEDTVCTAALTRREALLEIGGFDPGMPCPGYEDWDLAISLVERARRGFIIPEYLFRYRIRTGSMSSVCTESGPHAVLMRYIVNKHARAYREFLPSVLETIEQRAIEVGGGAVIPAPADPNIEFFKGALRATLGSRTWVWNGRSDRVSAVWRGGAGVSAEPKVRSQSRSC